MSTDILLFATNTSLNNVRDALQERPGDKSLIVDNDRNLAGCLNLSNFRHVDFAAGSGMGVTADLITHQTKTMLTKSDTLRVALQVLYAASKAIIPITSSRASLNPIGFVAYKKVPVAYNRALLDARA